MRNFRLAITACTQQPQPPKTSAQVLAHALGPLSRRVRVMGRFGANSWPWLHEWVRLLMPARW